MGISDRLLGKKNVNGNPRIEAVHPSAALPGGEVRITGTGLRPPELRRPRVRFGELEGAVLISSDEFLVARVPASASSGPVVVSTNGHSSNPHQIKVAVPIAENLHPVTNPALDAEGNIYATFSGSRGQKVPVSIYKIDTNYIAKPFLGDLMNATAIAFDRAGQMYVSSRHDGAVYRVAPNGTMSTYAEGMGIATGFAFRKTRNRQDHVPGQSVFRSLRPGTGWACIRAGAGCGFSYYECSSPSFVEPARPAPGGRTASVKCPASSVVNHLHFNAWTPRSSRSARSC